jgi:ubiquinone/menaquinone biosynthesis C-methylase UbiE
LADVRYLPFACGSVSGASCISALEHVPADGDIKAAIEIGRILKPKSVWVVSVPLSTDRSGYCKKHWAAEIPSLIQRLFGVCLPIIMRTLNVDRTSSYFERFFSEADVVERIIKPSDCRQEEFATLRSGSFVTSLYRKVIPTGVFTILDYVMAKMLVLNDKIESGHAVILKLRKQ